MVPTSWAGEFRLSFIDEIISMTPAGIFGQKLGQPLNLKDAPSLITRTLRSAELAVIETRDDNPLPGLCGALPSDDAYLVSIKFRDYPDCECWERGRCVIKTDIRAGTTYLYDLKRDPRYVIDKPFHSLFFYLPRSALDDIARQAGAPLVGELTYQPGIGHDDTVVRHLGSSLLEALHRPDEANQLFVDHTMLAVTAHVAQTYGGLRRSAELARGGLAPWQARRACERSRRKNLAGANRGGFRFFGQPFLARLPRLYRPAAPPMAAAPAREYGQAVDERARPAPVGDCDIGRVCQSKPFHAGVFLGSRRQPGGVAPRNAGRTGKRNLTSGQRRLACEIA